MDAIPFTDLSNKQVIALLKCWKFEDLVPAFKDKNVNGAMLTYLDTSDELEELGVMLKIARKTLYGKIQEVKAGGGTISSATISEVNIVEIVLKFFKSNSSYPTYRII